MINIPNMMPEVVEAVHLMYEDYPDVELDCMLYLKHLVSDDPKMLSSVIDWFEERDKCKVCGAGLFVYVFKELHTELDERPIETLREMRCPSCEGGFTY